MAMKHQDGDEQPLEQAFSSETIPLQRTGRLNRAAVDKLLQYRAEIKRAHPDVVFEDSSELIHEAREERTRELEQTLYVSGS